MIAMSEALSPSRTDVEMSLGDHLEELRHRVILALLGVGVAAIGTLAIGRHLVAWVCMPLAQALREAGLPAQTYFFNPTESFTIYLKVSLVAALILAAPWVIYQLWLFVAAGLYATERRAVLMVAPFSALMTGLALAFTYWIMLPVCLMFFIGFSAGYPEAPPAGLSLLDRVSGFSSTAQGEQDPEPPLAGSPASPPDAPSLIEVRREDPADPTPGRLWLKVPEGEIRLFIDQRMRRIPLAGASMISPLIDVAAYASFISLVALGIVIGFQLPVVMLILGWTGLVDPRQLVTARKYGIFACFAAAAVLTPTDIVSMAILALPLWALFELGLLLMRWMDRGHAAET